MSLETEIDEPGPRVFKARPDMHNALRQDAGLDPVNHCAECWGVIKDGECQECGSTAVYENQ